MVSPIREVPFLTSNRAHRIGASRAAGSAYESPRVLTAGYAATGAGNCVGG